MTREAWNDISARCKSHEAAATEGRADKRLPLLARLDGRAFHTYTAGLRRPYDDRLSRCMLETAKDLLDDNHADIAYTQSDEITLLWFVDPTQPSGELPFGGRFQKLTSVLAGRASARFATLAQTAIPEKARYLPHFDCRVWSVPTPQDAVDVFVWRQWDARKNSVTMAAQSLYSHRELLNKSTGEKLEMLRRRGVNWHDYPDFFRTGTFLRRQVIDTTLSDAEREAIPEQWRPPVGVPVKRTRIDEVKPPIELTWQWLVGADSEVSSATSINKELNDRADL